MRRPVPIRHSLLFAVLATVLLLGGGILALTVVGSHKAIERVAQSNIEQAVASLDASLGGFFDPVRRNLRMLERWGESGRIAPQRPEEFRRLLAPLLEEHPQTSSVMLADPDGNELMLLRLPDKWHLRQTTAADVGRRVRVLEWTNDAKPEESFLESDYDPRKRPWFIGARARDGEYGDTIHWTDAYTFFTTKELGITASVQLDNGWVVALDVLLKDISDFTDTFARGRREVLVMNEKREVIGLPSRIPPAQRRDFYLKSPEELGIGSIADAVAAAARTGGPRTDAMPDEGIRAVRFEGPHETWWASAARYQLAQPGAGRGTNELWIAVVVPESELLAGATSLRAGILGLTVAMLLIGVFAAFRLARRFSRPIEALVRQSDRISQGELAKTETIRSSVLEVRRLADAHDRMRESLQTLFRLEQDLRIARQIQQHTFPARLPVVKGYDLTAWSDPADETGGDTYDVVGIHREGDRIRLSQEDGARVLLMLADAAGHGIGPALSVTQVRAMLRMAVRRETKLRRIVRDMNEQLCADLDGGRFITVWMAKLDPSSHTLWSLSAGQGPLLHYHAPSDTFDALNPALPPLGVLTGTDIPEAAAIPLDRGDVFAVFSDGIFEASDGDGGLFGIERVREIVRSQRKGSADDILHALRDAIAAFTKGARATDDRTAVILKRR